jgi:alkaline phosphatase
MKKTTLLTLFVALALTASAAQPRVKNVIYLIGDGMGFGSVSALLLSQNEKTGFEYAPVIGLSETCSANNHVTDSPAGGTALATGTRTCNGYLGVDPEGKQLTSILRKAQTMGKRTGIVVNTVLTEATPAAFYGGVKSRSESLRLAEQFVESGVDVAIGSGLSVFVGRPDSVDLTAELINRGYDVYLDWGATARSTADRFVSILPMSDVHRRNKSSNKTAGAADGAEVCLAAKLAADNGEEPTSADPTEYLTRAVEKALGTLERTADRNGYFLMIESAIIDGYGHNNDSEGMVEEMREFDRTLQMLVKYVESHPETLLVVTADHETGGTGVSYRSHEVGEEKPIILSFSTKGHTGTVVPIFAYGAGAEEFGAIMKNIELPKIIERLMQGKKKSKR